MAAAPSRYPPASPVSSVFPSQAAMRSSVTSALPRPKSDHNTVSDTHKPKRPSIFKFFTVREPSADALRKYEEKLQRQQNCGNARPSAVGMAMVSASALPATVPKVNSKWDGMPDTMSERDQKSSRSSAPFLRLTPIMTSTTSSDQSSSRAPSYRRPYRNGKPQRTSLLSSTSLGSSASRSSETGSSSSTLAPTTSHSSAPYSGSTLHSALPSPGIEKYSRATTSYSTVSSELPRLSFSPESPLEDSPATPSFPFPRFDEKSPSLSGNSVAPGSILKRTNPRRPVWAVWK